LDRLLASTVPHGEPDAVPDLPVGEPRSKLGEVYELGVHRLMCGDATEAMGSLFTGEIGCVLTDPPYGIDLDTDYRKMGTGSEFSLLKGVSSKQYRPVIGDNIAFDPTPFVDGFAEVREQFWFGADYYRRLLSSEDRDGSWLVWDKRSETSDAGFGSGFELIWSRQAHKRVLLRFFFFGAFGAEASNRLHPTQKPTALLAEILTRWTPEGCVVADPFGGSGSTLIAAEKTGRTCLMTELDPLYCDVIRDRYEAFVGG